MKDTWAEHWGVSVILIGGMVREKHEAKQKEKDHKNKTMDVVRGGRMQWCHWAVRTVTSVAGHWMAEGEAQGREADN